MVTLADIKPYGRSNYTFEQHLRDQGWRPKLEDGDIRYWYREDGSGDEQRLMGSALRDQRDRWNGPPGSSDSFAYYERQLERAGYKKLDSATYAGDVVTGGLRGYRPDELSAFRVRGLNFTQPYDPYLWAFPGSSIVTDPVHGKLLKLAYVGQVGKVLPDINPEKPFRDFVLATAAVAGAAYGLSSLTAPVASSEAAAAAAPAASSAPLDWTAEQVAFGSEAAAPAVNASLAGVSGGAAAAAAGPLDWTAEELAFGSEAAAPAVNASLAGLGTGTAAAGVAATVAKAAGVVKAVTGAAVGVAGAARAFGSGEQQTVTPAPQSSLFSWLPLVAGAGFLVYALRA